MVVKNRRFKRILKLIVYISILHIFLISCLFAFVIFTRSQKYNLKIEGTLFVVNKADKTITVFDLSKGKTLKEIELKTNAREIVALPNNEIAITNRGDSYLPGKSISIFDSKELMFKRKIRLDGGIRPYGIVTLGNSKKVAIASGRENNLLIVDTEKDSIEAVIPTQQKTSYKLVVHPFKPLAYVTNKKSGSVSVINYETKVVLKIIKTGYGTQGIDITPDGKEVWVTNARENTISVIKTETNTVEETLNTGKGAYRLKFSLDGKYAFVSNADDGTIFVFNRSIRHKIKTITLPGRSSFIQRVLYHTPTPVDIFMHPNSRHAFIANSNADKVEVLDLKTLKIVGNINTGHVPGALLITDY